MSVLRKLGKLLPALAVCFALCAMPAKALAQQVSNGILTLSVQEEPYGSFMLKKADNDALTYSQFYSSYTTVTVGGVSCRFGEGETVQPAYATENNEIITVQRFGGVQVTQTLVLTTGNSSAEDMLLIRYTVENQTQAEALVSIRVLIDPTLQKSETHMVSVNGVPCNTEKTFSGAEVADDWCVKDDSGTIVAYGILSTEDGKPDAMQVADWSRLYDRKSGYRTDGTAVIADNGVALSWENRTLAAGETLSVSTKYGLYSVDPEETTVPTKPSTGDNAGTGDTLYSVVPAVMAAFSAMSLGALAVTGRRKED